MTTWHWIRHGPTHEKNFVGWRDVPADLSNHEQIARLDRHLPEEAVLVSSDLIRSIHTADAIARAGRLRLSHEPDLRELHFGDWDGLHFSEVAARDPELSRAYWETPGDVRAPGGESWNETAHRVSSAVDRLTERHRGKEIIAVAHFGVILTQVQRALGVTAAETFSHKIDNLSVTSLHLGEEGWQASVINHLP